MALDFPSSPTNGQINGGYVWDGEKWLAIGTGEAGAGGTFIQAGAGAIERTMQNKARESVSVKDYGAQGDGIADDAPAIVAADAAAALLGASVYFPEGTYKWVTGTYCTKNNSVSWFANKDATIVFTGAVADAAINGAPHDCVIKGLQFDGHAAPNLAWLSYFTGIKNFGIEDCVFKGMQWSATVYDGAIDCWFNHNHVEKDAGPAPTVITEAIWVRDPSNGGTGGPTSGVQIIGNTFINMGCDVTGNNMVITHNKVRGWNYGAGIGAAGDRITIGHNQCSDSFGVDSNGVYPSGIEAYATNMVIVGNDCCNNQGNGIHVGGANSIVVGNHCRNNGQGGAGLVPAPYMHLGAGIVARFNAASNKGAHNSIFADNRCYDDQTTKTQSYGFGSDALVTGLVMGVNHFEGNKLGPFDSPFIGPAPFAALASEGMQINGGMEIDQKNAGAVIPVTANGNTHTLDGFVVVKFATAQCNVQRVASVFPGYVNMMRLTTTVAEASMGADIIDIRQIIEGTRMARASWGTATAKPISLGFWAKSSVAGEFSVTINNHASTAASNKTVKLAAGIATWCSVTFDLQAAGDWKKDTGVGAFILLRVASSGTGILNIASAINNTFEMTGFIVLVGDMVGADQAPRLMRPYSEELRICKRYWETIPTRFDSYAPGVNTIAWDVKWATEKRVGPTVTFGAMTALGSMDTTDPTVNTNDGVVVNVTKTGTAAGAFILAFPVIGDARLV